MVDHDPMAANLKSDPDLYCGLKHSARSIKIDEIYHMRVTRTKLEIP